jgi:hypothetical protein
MVFELKSNNKIYVSLGPISKHGAVELMRSISATDEFHTRPAPPRAKKVVQPQTTTIVRPNSTPVKVSRLNGQLVEECIIRVDSDDEDEDEIEDLDNDDNDAFGNDANARPIRSRQEINAVI